MHLQKLEDYSLGEFIEIEYSYLCGRGSSGSSEFYLPFIGELIEETWHSATQDKIARDVQGAISNKDHISMGLSRKDFFTIAMRGNIPSIDINSLKIMEVQEQVMGYLRTRHMSYIDYQDNVVNSPIGSGVW